MVCGECKSDIDAGRDACSKCGWSIQGIDETIKGRDISTEWLCSVVEALGWEPEVQDDGAIECDRDRYPSFDLNFVDKRRSLLIGSYFEPDMALLAYPDLLYSSLAEANAAQAYAKVQYGNQDVLCSTTFPITTELSKRDLLIFLECFIVSVMHVARNCEISAHLRLITRE